MPLNRKLIRRWYLMLSGKSIWHVNQDIGKCFAVDRIKGYYNNMTEKVTKMSQLLDNNDLPLLNTAKGDVEMPVAIFQYGLGAYDLYLLTGKGQYLKKFNQTVEWTVAHQDEKGRWSTFFYVYPDHPYGAMAQGEGASLLLRAYIHSGKIDYLKAAQRAIDFMLVPVDKGGTALYDNNDVVFAEYTHLPVVMNGWIFAWWGLYDFVLTTHDTGVYKDILVRSCNTLIRYMPRFKASYWSKYDLGGMMASPFYHNLHIAQMQAMYELTGEDIFNQYAKQWKKQQKNPFYKSMAFVKKAIQKLAE